jgi:teichuronic acid biosynthesis glycosyltransferase TuaC
VPGVLFSDHRMSQLSRIVAQPMARSSATDAVAAAVSIPSQRETALRVLAVIPGDGEGNSFIFARRQVESLVKLGIAVNVFYLRSRTSPLSLLREFGRFRKAIVAFSPDIVHAHYGTMTSLLCVLGTKRPVVVTFRGSDLNPAPDNGFFRNNVGLLLSQISALRASAIICTSARLCERLWWRKNRTTIVPSGVDLDAFKPCDKGEAREILGWRDGEKVVLINVGNVPLLKGLPLAREAVDIAAKNLGTVRLFELRGDVPPEKIPIYLNAADCLVLASKYEGSPNILKEALACNLPVVTVDVGDSIERLDGVYPSQVVSRNSASLGRGICEILRAQRRSNGREKTMSCSNEKIAERLGKIYERVRERAIG